MAGLRLAAALAALAPLVACTSAPAEPERPSSTAAPAPAPTVAPLLWDAPGTWAKLDVPGSDDRKAAYRVDQGGDGDGAEATVYFRGTGARGTPAAGFKEWFGAFEGAAGANAAKERFETHGLEVDMVEVNGTYRMPLTPAPRGKKATGVQMLKKKWRLCGAVVKTPDRGNWFFELKGPDEAVAAARSAFHTMLESAR